MTASQPDPQLLSDQRLIDLRESHAEAESGILDGYLKDGDNARSVAQRRHIHRGELLDHIAALSDLHAAELAALREERDEHREEYEILRDAIVEALDPADDDVAEIAILERAIGNAGAERAALQRVRDIQWPDWDDAIKLLKVRSPETRLGEAWPASTAAAVMRELCTAATTRAIEGTAP